MRISIFWTAATLALSAAGFGGQVAAEPVTAQRPSAVVELFTSQGCNSCPPADAIFGELVAKADVVALAYHVDYWDYLGWRDTLGSPENTRRQQDYGRSFGLRSVYTPQAVINGRIHVNGAKRTHVFGAIDELKEAGEAMSVDVKAKQVADSVIIEAGPGPAGAKAHLVLVYFEGSTSVSIERGENKGSVFTYWNAVTDVQTAGMWHGEAMRFELPASEIEKKGGCVALLQAMNEGGLPGPILGAAVVRKP